MNTTLTLTNTPAGAPVIGTTSARPTSLRSTFRAEWTKLRTLRSTWMTLAISAVASVGLAAIVCAAQVSQWDDLTAKQRSTFDATSSALIGVLFATLIVGSLAVRSVTNEYTSGMIRVTFAATPRRGRVLVAKTVIVAAMAFIVSLAANLVAFVLSQQILSSKHIESSLGDPGVLRAVVFGALAVSLFSVVALGLGTMMRRTAAATTTLSLVVIGGQLLGLAIPEGARSYLPSSVMQAMVSVRRTSELLAPNAALAVLVAYAAVAAIAARQFIRRDA